MGKNGLFVMSIGFITVVCSALGKNMSINYPVLSTGLFLVVTGYFVSNKEKNKLTRDKKGRSK